MRFLILTQYFPPEIGGAATRLLSMAEELVRLGHEVEVVTARPNYPRGKFFDGHSGKLYVREERNGLVVHRVWLHTALGGGLSRMVNYASFSLTCLLAIFRASRPDYLFVESPPLTTSLPAFLANLLWRVPFIFSVSDLWPDAAVDTGFLREGFLYRMLLGLEAWSYQRAAFVNAVTEGIRDTLITRKKVPAHKVLFLPNGANLVRFQPRPPDLRLKVELGLAQKKIILWAGTIGHAHGLDNVMRAAKLLENRPEIHFLFLGDGSTRQSLQQLAAELGLQNVTFRDPVSLDLLPPYYSIAECGLASLRPLPTHDGARPSKVFPLLASGKPLLFAGKGECAQLVEAARAGIVVAPEDPAALAHAITQAFDAPEELRAMGENGRRYMEAHFDWSQLVQDWVLQLSSAEARPGLNAQQPAL